MGIFKKKVQLSDFSDAGLVSASLGGDRDAFGVIVGRYQSLLCSLAYSSVGDIKHSEDIAQEVFIDAWHKLATLRDPEKLKSWLCGILRFKVSHYRRKEARQPLGGAGQLDDVQDSETKQSKVDDGVIKEQEQQLLWQALEKLPNTYREPLILFYREHQSVEHVATELDLTEATVKKRLSRGRKLLQQAMIIFVEDALQKSKPGASFTSAVLLAIVGIAAPKTKASVLGAGVVQTGSWFKLASVLTMLASFSGVISSFFSLRASLDQSRTKREKHTAIKHVSLFFFIAIVYVIGMLVFKRLALADMSATVFYSIAAHALAFSFGLAYILLLIYMLKGLPKMRAQERRLFPEAFQGELDTINSRQREFKTRFQFLGIPLLHFKLGMPEQGDSPAFAWIAGGDRAYGLLFAWGGYAMAPISVGIVSVGIVSIGAVGLGPIAIGTLAIGVIGFGASAIAYKAYSSLSSLGWESAFSAGFAAARDAAIAPIAFAEHVNSELAGELVNLSAFSQNYLWVLTVMAVLVIVPAIWHSNMVRRRMAKKNKQDSFC
ncbi:sigma-70 family RNA polymerase sigma factor [Teredinibacter sp. KSP-S5-2]|uniref:RNA polymerase sigma factor n=1 Tax=Teredinibacter sp. KSP-S5-2 TaxID=3034506 RepID=UPI002934CD49|nr:sigma-70 family RNA polymerase sigma factor [Teredinibacter sp. KSP-S5-2]WNO09852.1 sigma-70 family RNA polymerase sigma factor [Teredinibacter sp. KSP-S5-2]